MALPFVISVVGPTAVGKSELADVLAQTQQSCVISADSMQIYRRLDIGTAKMSADQMSVPHFGIDIVELTEPFSAAEYQSYARPLIESFLKASLKPVVCGGTGLYVRAALDDMRFPAGNQRDNPIRDTWQNYLDVYGEDALHAELLARDPQSAEVIDKHNHKRVIRALEMYAVGASYHQQAIKFKERTAYYPTCYIGLRMEREALYRHIDNRVDAMLRAGLIDEAQQLKDSGLDVTYTARHAIGYKELFRAFSGEISLDQAVEDIKRHSRRYAKRQMTWFRGDPRIRWIDVEGLTSQQIRRRAARIINRYSDEVKGEFSIY